MKDLMSTIMTVALSLLALHFAYSTFAGLLAEMVGASFAGLGRCG